MKAGRTLPSFTSDGSAPRITYRQYISWLNQVVPKDEFSRMCFAIGAYNMGLGFDDSDMVTEDRGNVMTLPSLLIAAVSIAAKYPLVPPGQDQINTCLKEAKDHYGPAEGIDFDFAVEKGAGQSKDDILRTIIWILSSNHQYQGDMPHEMANNLILSGLSSFGSLKVDSQLIDNHFTKNVGVTAKEYFIILFALLSLAYKQFTFKKMELLRNIKHKEHMQPALEAVLTSLSFKSDEQLNSAIFGHSKDYSGKAKAEAIIALRPFLQVNDELFLCAGSPYLKIQCTRKFLPKALYFARQDTGKASNPLSNFIGESRLEPFFKELCNIWAPSEGHFDEYYYEPIDSAKSCDRIIFEKTDDGSEIAILVQLKAKTLIEASLFGGKFEAVKKDIQSAFSEMLYKSVNYLSAAKEKLEQGRHRSDSADITTRILAAKKIVFLGISPDVPPIFTSKPVREIVEEKVVSEVSAGSWKWLNEHYERVYWHIISLHEFEAFLCIPKEYQVFHRTIHDYFVESELETNPISADMGLPDSYRSYILKKYCTPGADGKYIMFLPELQRVFDDFQKDIKSYYGW